MATGRIRPGWDPPDPASPGLFTYGTDVVSDVNQGVSGGWWYAPVGLPKGDVTFSVFVQATQTLLPGATATLVAASVVDEWNFIAFPGTVTLVSGTTYTMVATTDGSSASDDPAGYPIDNGTVHLPGPGRFEAGAGPYPDDSTWNGQHGVDLEMVEDTISATLTLLLPAETVELDADADINATLDVDLPADIIDLDADADVTATLSLTLPAEQIILAADNLTGGSVLPCNWDIPDPLCCDTWDTLDPAVQAAAKDYAATVLWAATGRQYGLCEHTVRPCGMKRCQDGGAEFFGYDWTGGTWIPYIFNGVWYNCGCATACCCDPRCQVRLMGPVDSIIQVTIGGIVVPDTSYRVDDQHWLVRTDGECWPQCSDMNSDDGDNVFTVTYRRGVPVPSVLLMSAATLACEWGKACSGAADCRLSNRVTSLARNGVQIDMVDPQSLLDSGMTGIFEVDSIITALNPYGLKQRLRVYAPELRVPRTVTSG